MLQYLSEAEGAGQWIPLWLSACGSSSSSGSSSRIGSSSSSDSSSSLVAVGEEGSKGSA